MSRLLEGTSVLPRTNKQAKALIGKNVIWLQSRDIDKSGRGYYFPRYGKIVDVVRREIAIDSPGNFEISLSNLVEMVLNENEPANHKQR